MRSFRCECGHLNRIKFRGIECPVCASRADFRENEEKKCARGHTVIWNISLLDFPNSFSLRWTCRCNAMYEEWEVANFAFTSRENSVMSRA